MNKVVLKNSYLSGSVTLPPSKSVAHRALVCSFLAGGGTVEPISDSKDMTAMRRVIESLKNNESVLDCIESGNTLRFMIPVAAALGREVTFIGSGRLPERPLGEYLRLLPEHGVECECNGGLPLKIKGQLKAGTFEIAGDISSQYITGLLLALPLLDGDSEIILTTELKSKPYVDITVKVLDDFGVTVEETERGYYIKGSQQYKNCDYTVEGDWSQAAFFLAGGALTGEVTLKGLDLDSPQGDKAIVEVLRRFGAVIEISADGITVKKSDLCGIETDVTDIPDAVPALAVVAAYAKGKTVFKGVERLRFKESDRVESIAENLRKMGIRVETDADTMTVYGSHPKGAELLGYNDHRILMSFCIAALRAQGETSITDPESIEKTYPDFYSDYNGLGGKANVICDR